MPARLAVLLLEFRSWPLHRAVDPPAFVDDPHWRRGDSRGSAADGVRHWHAVRYGANVPAGAQGWTWGEMAISGYDEEDVKKRLGGWLADPPVGKEIF